MFLPNRFENQSSFVGFDAVERKVIFHVVFHGNSEFSGTVFLER
jgi:hypothetical protein